MAEIALPEIFKSYDLPVSCNIIYAYSIDDASHKGLLKVGYTSTDFPLVLVAANSIPQEKVEEAAKKRIKEQTGTAGVHAIFEYAELALRDTNYGLKAFDDSAVHNVLLSRGYKRAKFDYETSANEWFCVDLDAVKKAVADIRKGTQEIEASKEEFALREEQLKAIDDTIEQYKNSKQMLWNAKMRFGKTVSAWELIKRKEYKRTLILTHRPSVREGWFEDYRDLMQFDATKWDWGMRRPSDGSMPKCGIGASLQDLRARAAEDPEFHYVYFVSMQDLRGKDKVDKQLWKKTNELIYQTKWNLVVVDEAHEGTTTKLGKSVLEKLKASNPFMLYLSGTPYNILNQFQDKEIYTWDYLMEQERKETWAVKHPNEKNHYAGLARLNIVTYNLGDVFKHYTQKKDEYFDFGEFFRTWDAKDVAAREENKDTLKEGIMPTSAKEGEFVHEKDVRDFLNLMHDETGESGYPFANEGYIKYFRHSFWLLPGVASARALSAILQEPNGWWQQEGHQYKIVNVAGNGDTPGQDDKETEDVVEKAKKEANALQRVKEAIAENERTITLSCGRLTTGVTVKQWNAVFMLFGSTNTQAAGYMQTIFRGQSPLDAPDIKPDCFAFDFSPNRTLVVINDYLDKQPHSGSGSKEPMSESERQRRLQEEKIARIKKFLQFCPVIAKTGSTTTRYDDKLFISQVNRAYAEYVIKNGFSGGRLYNNLYELSDDDVAILDQITKELKKHKIEVVSPKSIKVNDQMPGGKGKPGQDKNKDKDKDKGKDTDKDSDQSQDNDNGDDNNENGVGNKPTEDPAAKRRRLAMGVLDQLMIRIPLMLFGLVESTDKLTLTDFVDSVPDESWNVFIPTGVTKDLFKKIVHLINNEVFITSVDNILTRTKAADALPVTRRVEEIASILHDFHYPDKETVLTPWRAVNMHMVSTLGGYNFYDEDFRNQVYSPQLKDVNLITKDVFGDPTSRILEINSKSGVYPLWLAYSLFRFRCPTEESASAEQQEQIWKDVVGNNLFVLCMSPMAVAITKRVLVGFKNYPTNCHYQEDLIKLLKSGDDRKDLIKDLQTNKYWDMKDIQGNDVSFRFKAVVGNPPYQLTGGSGGNNDAPIYQEFSSLANEIAESYASIIEPSRWYAAGRENLLKDYRHFMLNCGKITVLNTYPNGSEVFPRVEIKGGVCFYLYEEKKKNSLCHYTLFKNGVADSCEMDLARFDILIREPMLSKIVEQVEKVVKEEELATGSPVPRVNTIISNDTPFGIPSNPRTSKKTPFKVYSKPSPSHDVLLFHIENQKRKKEYVALADLKKNTGAIDVVKVFIPGSGGSGNDQWVLGRPEFAQAHSVCSQSYLYAAFPKSETETQTDAETRARNFISYLSSKFFRALVAAMKITQSAPERVYRFVPLLDLTASSDIDWTKDISDIDCQLFEKFRLSPEQIDFINSTFEYFKLDED